MLDKKPGCGSSPSHFPQPVCCYYLCHTPTTRLKNKIFYLVGFLDEILVISMMKHAVEQERKTIRPKYNGVFGDVMNGIEEGRLERDCMITIRVWLILQWSIKGSCDKNERKKPHKINEATQISVQSNREQQKTRINSIKRI